EAALVFLPIGGAQVFDHVDPRFRQPRIEEVERRADMAHHMAAVVEHDVGCAELVDHAAQKCEVLLVADADLDLVLLELLAAGVDVESDDAGVRAEIALHICKEPPSPQPISIKVTVLSTKSRKWLS